MECVCKPGEGRPERVKVGMGRRQAREKKRCFSGNFAGIEIGIGIG